MTKPNRMDIARTTGELSLPTKEGVAETLGVEPDSQQFEKAFGNAVDRGLVEAEGADAGRGEALDRQREGPAQARRTDDRGIDAMKLFRSSRKQSPPQSMGSDRLDHGEDVSSLAQLSQVELAAVEADERSNKQRVVLLNKLRWLRGPEPMPDYDALDEEAVTVALAEGRRGDGTSRA